MDGMLELRANDLMSMLWHVQVVWTVLLTVLVAIAFGVELLTGPDP